MKLNWKKWISVILAFVLAIQLLPVSSLAPLALRKKDSRGVPRPPQLPSCGRAELLWALRQ